LKTALFIAKRYLFSKKSTNVINLISGISVTGIAMSVMAMIIILSAINGLEGTVDDLSGKFDPDLKITPKEGKSFHKDKIPLDEIRNTEGVKAVSRVTEELCIVKYRDRFVHAMMKGVEEDFFNVSKVSQNMEDGMMMLEEGDSWFVMLDVSIAAVLEVYVSPRIGEFESVTLFAPVRNKKIRINSNPFNRKTVFLSGVFDVKSDDELKPVLVPHELANYLLEYEDEISAIEIAVQPGYQTEDVQQRIKSLSGDGFDVKTRFQQNELLYKVSQSEKWFVFAMLAFVLLLTSFNILASLTMLVIDKKEDINVLRSMGATRGMIRTIFFSEGLFINLLGAGIGFSLGAGIVLLQYHFHLIPLKGAHIDYYPVLLKSMDFVKIGVLVMVTGTACSWFPVRYLVRKHF
jgi:lipoprotein-releasing system permease protein